MKFKNGDKVLCVNPPEGHKTLVVGKVYTVTSHDPDDYVYLEELGRGGWWATRFQLLRNFVREYRSIGK